MDNIQTKELKGKVCFVTGGSRGVGRAIVLAMAASGADVAFTYRTSRETADRLAITVADTYRVQCRGYQADPASAGQLENAIRSGIRDVGPISILVNNAGTKCDKSFLNLTKRMWDEVMSVNIDGVLFRAQIVLQGMAGAGCGRIINMSSVIGLTGNFGQLAHPVIRVAVIGLTEVLARDLARKGITVNAVVPGCVESGMAGEMPPAEVAQVKAMTPSIRLGRPEEIAGAVLWLANRKSGFVTGHVLGGADGINI